MDRLWRKRLDHESPYWIPADADYFITVCAEIRGINHFCNPSLGPALLESIRYRHEKQIWFCHLAVLMPDHIHLLLGFPDVPSIARVVGDWKHFLARRHAIAWQENFFDHRLRNEENINQKAEYILQNPVRAGLIQEPKDWSYTWMPE